MNKAYLILLCSVIFIRSFSQTQSGLDSLSSKLSSLKSSEKAVAYYDLVFGYQRVDLEKTKHFAREAGKFANKESNPNAKAYAYMALAMYYAVDGMLDSSLHVFLKAKHFGELTSNNKLMVKICSALGKTYISSGKPEKGLENLFEGLRILEADPDLELELKIRTNITWAYLELKDYRNSIQFGRRSLKMMEDPKLQWIALYTYNNIAVSYGAIGNLDSAKYFIDNGIKAATLNNDLHALANGYFILGSIYTDAGRFDLAIQQYLKARPYREKVGNPLFLASDLYATSELYYKIGDYRKGVDAGLDALTIAEKNNLLLKFEGTYQSLARNYEGLKDFKNASKYYQRWAMAKDSVYKNASANAIAEMQTKYETEKKEQQLYVQQATLAEQRAEIQRTYVVIASLTLTIVFIVVLFYMLKSRAKRKQEIIDKDAELSLREAQMQASIQSQEAERKRFARDIHDGMGQLISALRLSLTNINSKSSHDERAEVLVKSEKILSEMHQEIRGIAFNLMPQTLIQQGLASALKEMALRVNESGRVMIRVTSFDIPDRLTEVQEISLYRVVQEWTNNILKYASASSIEIQLVGHDNEIAITIEDNGRGFATEVLESSSGNGWKNIKSRISLIKASLEIDSQANRSGTTMIIKVPVLLNTKTVSNVSADTLAINTI